MAEQTPDDKRQVALVTGGSRGIGRAVVQRLAADGFDVAFCYQSNTAAAEQTARLAEAAGARALAKPVDVADADAVRAFVAATEAELGPIAAVVNSAGIVRDKVLLSMKDDDWHSVIDTNLSGTYNVCRAAVFPLMKRRGGSIVNLSSVAGVYGNPGQANYSASKAGIIGLTRALAKEVGGYGIRVNAVAPGFIDTDMTGDLSEKNRTEMMAQIPLKRWGTADEVADMVSFLVSDRAAYVTAAVLNVDGGIKL
jgi:3-oxoacyl-[acyl-carrier protein] reductase